MVNKFWSLLERRVSSLTFEDVSSLTDLLGEGVKNPFPVSNKTKKQNKIHSLISKEKEKIILKVRYVQINLKFTGGHSRTFNFKNLLTFGENESAY